MSKICEICKTTPLKGNTWYCSSCFMHGKVKTENNGDGTISAIRLKKEKEAGE